MIDIGSKQKKNVKKLKARMVRNLIDMGHLLNRRFVDREFPITAVYEILSPATDEFITWMTTGLKPNKGNYYTIFQSKFKDEQRPYGLAMLRGTRFRPYQFSIGQHNIRLHRNEYAPWPFSLYKGNKSVRIYREKYANKPFRVKKGPMPAKAPEKKIPSSIDRAK